MAAPDDDVCLSFLVEWIDPQSRVIHEFRLRYFVPSSELEMLNVKSRKIFLKRSTIPSLDLSCMHPGSRITVLARSLTIREFGDELTREFLNPKDSETTCAIIKPNAYANIGRIMEAIQASPLRITKLKMFKLSNAMAEDFYAEHAGKPFFVPLTNFIASDAIVAMELTGENAIENWRALIGPTDSVVARRDHPHSIRALYGVDKTRNAVHGSDSKKSAQREIDFFFERKSISTAQLNNCSLCVVKPHAFPKAGGQVVSQILDANLEISAMELLDLPTEFLEVYRGVVPDFTAFCAEFTAGRSLVMEVREVNVVEKLRALVGPNDSELARDVRPQTMRAKFGADAIHCTDLPEDALSLLKIPLARIERLFSRGSGHGGQNLHASHSRCLLKFNLNTADWLPLRVRHAFIQHSGQFVSPKGTVVIVREDTRCPADNEKLAIAQLQALLDKAAELAQAAEDRGVEVEPLTEQERIKASKTAAQLARYKDTVRKEKQFRSETKRNRKVRFVQ